MESFFSSLKTERTAGKTYRTRDRARADVFDDIERFYNPRRRHSTLGYVSPIDFEPARRGADAGWPYLPVQRPAARLAAPADSPGS